MLDKPAKVKILRHIIGLGEAIDPPFIVPHNSVSNLQKRLGNCECIMAPPPNIVPVENTFRNLNPVTSKCMHCENMAKNFLYLESLIRNNYDQSHECKLCSSALKYLQYINKSILQVFGNFESIMQAAKLYAQPSKPLKAHKSASKLKSKSGTSRHKLLPKNKSKLLSKSSKHGHLAKSKLASSKMLLKSGSKLKAPSKHSTVLKKSTNNSKLDASGHSMRSGNRSKLMKAKKSLATVKQKATALLKGFKPRPKLKH